MRRVGWFRELPIFEELDIALGERRLEAADVGVPFVLHFVHGANDLLERIQPSASLHQRQGALAILGALEDEMRQGPPMQIVQVEVAAHAGTATVGDNRAQGDYASILDVLCEIGAGGKLFDPPYRIRVGVNPS